MSSDIVYRLIGFVLIVFYSIMGVFIILYWNIVIYWRLYKLPKMRRELPPPCLLDPEHGVHKYLTINGNKWHYVEKGDPDKPLLLFVHGFPEFWFSWRHQLAEFSKDYRCVALDMLGFGDSDKPTDLEEYKIPKLADDIKEFVTSLGYEKFTIISHDFGAIITWHFFEKYGKMLENFVTITGPPIEVYRHILWSNLTQLRQGWYIFFFQCPILPELFLKLKDYALIKMNKAIIPFDELEAYKYMYVRPGALTSAINYYRANYESVLSRKREINPSTDASNGLFMLGANDGFISKTMPAEMQKTYKNLKVLVMRNASHSLPQENHEEINVLIRQFLE